MTVQQFFAALVLAVCVALLVYHGLGAHRQARVLRWWQGFAARARYAWARWRTPRRPPTAGHAGRAGDDAADSDERAEREAADAIERARRGARRGEKVVRPRFGDRRKDLH